jgi:hypothetical protein
MFGLQATPQSQMQKLNFVLMNLDPMTWVATKLTRKIFVQSGKSTNKIHTKWNGIANGEKHLGQQTI